MDFIMTTSFVTIFGIPRYRIVPDPEVNILTEDGAVMDSNSSSEPIVVQTSNSINWLIFVFKSPFSNIFRGNRHRHLQDEVEPHRRLCFRLLPLEGPTFIFSWSSTRSSQIIISN